MGSVSGSVFGNKFRQDSVIPMQNVPFFALSFIVAATLISVPMTSHAQRFAPDAANTDTLFQNAFGQYSAARVAEKYQAYTPRFAGTGHGRDSTSARVNSRSGFRSGCPDAMDTSEDLGDQSYHSRYG